MAQGIVDCRDVREDNVLCKLEGIVGSYEFLKERGFDAGSYRELEMGILEESKSYFEGNPDYCLDDVPRNGWGSLFVGFYKKINRAGEYSNKEISELFFGLIKRNIAAADVVLKQGDGLLQRQAVEDVLAYEEDFPSLDAQVAFGIRYFAA